ncbi:hypothetical protein F5Y10DRAFT_254620 [Nemania abortiva]|nr:hypothetical protein F5Y10DRAFT_254620 [Nemania abortiva]
MTEAGISFGTKILTRWYDKGKNYKGDIQGSKARLVELRDTINASRDHLNRFPWEYSESSAADLEEYLRKGERVLNRETTKLKEDRGRGRTRYAIRPGARERRSRSTSRVSEAIARLGRKEASHKKRAESREKPARGSQRGIALSNPEYYERASRGYGESHHRRAEPRAASVPGRTHQVHSDRLVAWLNEGHGAPATERGRSSRGWGQTHQRAIQHAPSSSAAPSNAMSDWTYRTHRTHETHRTHGSHGTHGTRSVTTERGNAQPRGWIAGRDSYSDMPPSDPVPRSTVTVYTRDRRNGRIIETRERFSRTSRIDSPERVSRGWPEPLGTRRTIIFG